MYLVPSSHCLLLWDYFQGKRDAFSRLCNQEDTPALPLISDNLDPFFCPNSLAELLLVSIITIILIILWTHHHLHRYNHYGCNAQGLRSNESTRLPPMWPGFKSRRRSHMWVEFVVGSLSCSERFLSGYSGFPLSLKTNTFKFQFDLERTYTFQRVLMNSLVLRG